MKNEEEKINEIGRGRGKRCRMIAKTSIIMYKKRKRAVLVEVLDKVIVKIQFS